MTKILSAVSSSTLAAMQNLAKTDGLPEFLSRKPGDSIPTRPLKAPRVPKLDPDGTPSLAHQEMNSIFEDTKPAPKKARGKKTATGLQLIEGVKTAIDGVFEKGKLTVTQLPPVVAEGAYRTATEAEAKTGITALRARAGVMKKIKAVAPPAGKKVTEPKAADFTVKGHGFKGKAALMMQAVARKAGATVKLGNVTLKGKERGATMAQLLKVTGWAACRSTLGKLCRDCRCKLQSNDGKGDAKRFWIDAA